MPPLRDLPAVHRVLGDQRVAAYVPLLGEGNVKAAIHSAFETIRRSGGDISHDGVTRRIVLELERARFRTPARVINATGILLHTNLGRAPLARSALDAVTEASQGYMNLEYDLDEGRRGSRYGLVSPEIANLTGAQNALVVNNCASAVLLILDTFAKGREAIVARGQLIEIGAGFRLPEIVGRSGARLVEVGAVNKVYLHDYERAFSAGTAVLLRSHSSNFRMSGFTHEVAPAELVGLGHRAGIVVVEDLGSGAVFDLRDYGLPHERTVQEAIGDGLDLVAFSGDKLLGGPQAGIIVGATRLIARLLNNPLVRALRVDKMTLAALAQTVRLHAARASREEIPLVSMLAWPLERLQARAQAYTARIAGSEAVESSAFVGGGVLPDTGLASIAIAVRPKSAADQAAHALRTRPVPIVVRIEDGRIIADLRTIFPDEDAMVIDALSAVA